MRARLIDAERSYLSVRARQRRTAGSSAVHPSEIDCANYGFASPLAGWHSQACVKPHDFSVEHRILHDVHDELAEFAWSS